MTVASLPMYQRPELETAHNTLWGLIRDNLRDCSIDAPDELSPGGAGLEFWQRPDLCFSQTCGRPYRLLLHNKTTLIGTPDYGLENCPAGYYQSVFVVRKLDQRDNLKDFATARFAYNETISQSGWAAPQVKAKTLGFNFKNIILCGRHATSARMVEEGAAEIASIDAVTWKHLQEYEDFAQYLRVLDRTDPTPGLPYIAAKGADGQKLFGAVEAAIASCPEETRSALGLKGLVAIPHKDYMALPEFPVG